MPPIERRRPIANESIQCQRTMPPKQERRPSHASTYNNDQASKDFSVQSENEELRRLLMEAQELLIKRNERIADLEDKLQTLSVDRHTGMSVSIPRSQLKGCERPEEHASHATPTLRLWGASSAPDSDSSLTENEADSIHEHKSPIKQRSSKRIQPSEPNSATKGKIRHLPREQEMNATETLHVMEEMIVDGTGDSGTYTGTILKKSRMPHGKGRMVYDKYRSYMGAWEHGHWHGKGHMMSQAYDYKGMFVYDLKDGIGILKWSDGRVYKGEFVDDRHHGQGVLLYPDGSAYKGEFRHNTREGKGEARFAGGGGYVGYWKGGVSDGHGQCTWSDGSIYLGEWRNGKMHGHGIELRADGSVRHEGLFEENEPVLNRGKEI